MTSAAPDKYKNGSIRWRPKRWEPVYEQIVLLSIVGRSNKALAEMFGYTEQHICNILHTPEAALTRAAILERMHERQLESIPAKLEATAVKAIDRIHNVIHNDDLFEKSPFAVVDKSFKVLEAAGHIRLSQNMPGGIHVEAGGRAIILTEAAAERMRDTVKMLQAKEPDPIPIDNIEYEIVDKERE